MSNGKRTTAELMSDFDLSAPLGKHEKPLKKGHKCPHDRKNPTGMEVCRECGDFGNCAICGVEYISRDIYYQSDTLCWPCSEVARLEELLRRARIENDKRIAAIKAKGMANA